MKSDSSNKNRIPRFSSLIGRILDAWNRARNLNWRLNMGRISVDLPDELEKQLRFKTVERFGGKKGDLSKAVEEAVRTWIAMKE